jgi:hypothetical protein
MIMKSDLHRLHNMQMMSFKEKKIECNLNFSLNFMLVYGENICMKVYLQPFEENNKVEKLSWVGFISS